MMRCELFPEIQGFLTKSGKCIILEEKVFNNRDLPVPVSPSDLPPILFAFLEECRAKWGFARQIFIDSADAATILECEKFKRKIGCAYIFNAAWKKTTIIDRINLQGGWLARGDFLILENCREHLRELNSYSWKDDKDEPEDRNDHTINAAQYAWLPYKTKIGFETKNG